jgi:hypothetical protein
MLSLKGARFGLTLALEQQTIEQHPMEKQTLEQHPMLLYRGVEQAQMAPWLQ